jgi:hypothetical protein
MGRGGGGRGGEGGERKAGRGEVDRFGLERRSRGRKKTSAGAAVTRGQKGEQVASPRSPRAVAAAWVSDPGCSVGPDEGRARVPVG